MAESSNLQANSALTKEQVLEGALYRVKNNSGSMCRGPIGCINMGIESSNCPFRTGICNIPDVFETCLGLLIEEADRGGEF